MEVTDEYVYFTDTSNYMIAGHNFYRTNKNYTTPELPKKVEDSVAQSESEKQVSTPSIT